MGFFDKILSAIGFESEDDDEEVYTKPKKEKKQKKESLTGAKFDLSEEFDKEDRELSRFGSKNDKNEDEEDLEIQTPETQTEIEKIILKVKNGESILLNLANFSDEDRVRALDFISGALFILNRTIRKVDGTLFLIK